MSDLFILGLHLGLILTDCASSCFCMTCSCSVCWKTPGNGRWASASFLPPRLSTLWHNGIIIHQECKTSAFHSSALGLLGSTVQYELIVHVLFVKLIIFHEKTKKGSHAMALTFMAIFSPWSFTDYYDLVFQ